MTLTIAMTVDDVLNSLASGARPIAGGTDLVVGSRQGKGQLPDQLVAIDRVSELATVEQAGTSFRLGSCLTHAALMTNSAIVEHFTAIADAAALVGSPATRNVGTLGGNVMNGSPAMDTGAPLVVLGAQAELRTAGSTRLVDLDELWTGPGTTSAQPNELCTALVIEEPHTASAGASSHGSAYVRLEYRRAMEIAIVGAAAAVTLDGDSVSSIRVALTAVAPKILEVPNLDRLLGSPVTDGTLEGPVLDQIAEAASEHASPISDLRASDRYRRHTIGVMARRAVDAAVRRARGEHIAVPVNRSLGIGAAP